MKQIIYFNNLKLLAGIILMVLTGCEDREWNNPFDPNCPKEIFTPTDFIAEQEGEQIKLSWSQPNLNISGFKIEKKIGAGNFTSVDTLEKGASTLSSNISEGGELYTFKLIALAGSNRSNEVTITITPVLKASVTTSEISNITDSTTTSGGTIPNDGGSTVTARGVVWSTMTNPTIENNLGKTINGTGTGTFISELNNLEGGTTYYVRAFTSNSEGTEYGTVLTFTTLEVELPSVNTLVPQNIIPGAATLGGDVTEAGASEIIERGVCWDINPTPTIEDNRAVFHLFGSDGIESFSREITGFLANTTYYVRAYAKNSNATAYGQEESWTTSSEIALPTVTTNEPEDITTSSAVLGGHVVNTGGTLVTEWGIVYGISPNPTVNDSKFVIQDTEINGGSGSIGVTINELDAGTNYYVRAYAINGEGTGYGEQKSFTTEQNFSLATTITTSSPENITSNSAVLGGDITGNGNSTVTERGIVYGTGQNPTINNYKIVFGYDVVSFSNLINGLNSNTTYFVRAYAINNQGVAYGNEVSFQTLETDNELVTDIDGNVYETVKIGEQVWFMSNLKTTKYNDGVPVSNIVDNFEWEHTNTGAYCWQNNLVEYKTLYGALYNWYAVRTDKLCPAGWHIPTDSEWSTLVNYLGGSGLAGGKLKSQSSWESPNKGATNSTGFTGLPGGQRNGNGAFGNIKIRGTFWSSTENVSGKAWLRYLSFSSPDCYHRDYYKIYGLSVRCIKD